MMNIDKTSYDTTLKKAVGAHMLTLFSIAAVTLVMEILFFFLLSAHDMVESSTRKYFLKYMLLPTGCNGIFVSLGYAFYRAKDVSLKQKEYILSFCTVFSAFIVAVVHGIFASTCLLFFLATIITVLYGDKLLTTITFLAALVGRCMSSIYCIDKSVAFDRNAYVNLVLASVILSGVYMLSLIIIRLETEKRNLIISSIHSWNEMKQKLRKDSLTGLYNRQALEEFFKEPVEYMIAEKSPSFLAIWDIDSFKKLNDTYGHLQGDAVLRYVGACCRAWEDWMVCFRYGGDEFCAVIFDSQRNMVTEQLREFQSNLRAYMSSGGERIPISISIGVTEFKEQQGLESMLERADQALYRAKNEKKGNIVFFEE